MPAHDLGGLGHAVAAATVGRRWVAAGTPLSRRVPHPIRTATGTLLAVRGADRLTGMANGAKVDLGHCEYQGRRCHFDWWFPHVGIAVDAVAPPGGTAETEHRRTWCEAHMVVYFGSADVGTAEGMELLRQLAAERRAVAGI